MEWGFDLGEEDLDFLALFRNSIKFNKLF
jgi:hypothetical protein